MSSSFKSKLDFDSLKKKFPDIDTKWISQILEYANARLPESERVRIREALQLSSNQFKLGKLLLYLLSADAGAAFYFPGISVVVGPVVARIRRSIQHRLRRFPALAAVRGDVVSRFNAIRSFPLRNYTSRLPTLRLRRVLPRFPFYSDRWWSSPDNPIRKLTTLQANKLLKRAVSMTPRKSGGTVLRCRISDCSWSAICNRRSGTEIWEQHVERKHRAWFIKAVDEILRAQQDAGKVPGRRVSSAPPDLGHEGKTPEERRAGTEGRVGKGKGGDKTQKRSAEEDLAAEDERKQKKPKPDPPGVPSAPTVDPRRRASAKTSARERSLAQACERHWAQEAEQARLTAHIARGNGRTLYAERWDRLAAIWEQRREAARLRAAGVAVDENKEDGTPGPKKPPPAGEDKKGKAQQGGGIMKGPSPRDPRRTARPRAGEFDDLFGVTTRGKDKYDAFTDVMPRGPGQGAAPKTKKKTVAFDVLSGLVPRRSKFEDMAGVVPRRLDTRASPRVDMESPSQFRGRLGSGSARFARRVQRVLRGESMNTPSPLEGRRKYMWDVI
ncbi:hypothetical protein K402DRAFT_455648 [Aulographum hederae CBS 113979]|uniref:Uncharacterized protein n=1 Tax=Aulographum hederae CBS 113979 TaxID=1176131 RepID=A0A6G1GVJ4_9PEZI|nr:hypothetical protein K402DRAFT_455648 [Aulographum hederae CBS 113979]